jgi:hypothetical protein
MMRSTDIPLSHGVDDRHAYKSCPVFGKLMLDQDNIRVVHPQHCAVVKQQMKWAVPSSTA